MAMAREYDLVLFGATGYTGLYTAEHITSHLPTNLKWAIAGRSAEKLQNIAHKLGDANRDRNAPAIEVVQLDDTDLIRIAKKTKVLLNTVGPYALYSEPVVKACAENGTHYLDVTGEAPWVAKMVEKYHSRAQASGAIVISQCGVESVPADLMSFMLSRELSRSASAATAEVVFALHSLKGAPSGGTLATVLTMFDQFTPNEVQNSLQPSSMCPERPPASFRKGMVTWLTGNRTVPGLGKLTTNVFGAPDIPIVYRSWGLYNAAGKDESYGPNFQFSTYMRARNFLQGTFIHLIAMIGPMFLLLPPVRWLLRLFVYQPGQGPSREEVVNDFLEYRALAYADNSDMKASGRLCFKGSLYQLTGIFLAQAAATLLYDDGFAAKKLGGGLLTPATLGTQFADRLESFGAKFETSMVNI